MRRSSPSLPMSLRKPLDHCARKNTAAPTSQTPRTQPASIASPRRLLCRRLTEAATCRPLPLRRTLTFRNLCEAGDQAALDIQRVHNCVETIAGSLHARRGLVRVGGGQNELVPHGSARANANSEDRLTEWRLEAPFEAADDWHHDTVEQLRTPRRPRVPTELPGEYPPRDGAKGVDIVKLDRLEA